MGDTGLKYDVNYHLEQIEVVEIEDWDVLSQIFGTDVDVAGSEVSIDASVSLKKKQNKKWTKLFRLKKKTLLYQYNVIENFEQRFRNVTNLELKQPAEKIQTKSTKLNNKFGVKLFQVTVVCIYILWS